MCLEMKDEVQERVKKDEREAPDDVESGQERECAFGALKKGRKCTFGALKKSGSI